MGVVTFVTVIFTNTPSLSKAVQGQGGSGKGLEPKSPWLARSDYEFTEERLKGIIGKLAQAANLNVVFDASTESQSAMPFVAWR